MIPALLCCSCLLGCFLLYLTTTHQRLLEEPLPAQPWRICALIILITSGSEWFMLLSPVAAFFTAFSLLMLSLMLAPFLPLILPCRKTVKSAVAEQL